MDNDSKCKILQTTENIQNSDSSGNSAYFGTIRDIETKPVIKEENVTADAYSDVKIEPIETFYIKREDESTENIQLECKPEPIFYNDHDYPRGDEPHPQYLVACMEELQEVDELADHDKLVSLKQPGGVIVPEFLNALQHSGIKILQYSESNAFTTKRILLLGATVYTKCTECDQTFSSQPSLMRHIHKVHKGTERCVCPKCGQRLFKTHLELHLKLCMTTACRYCHKPIGKGLMKKHFLETHKQDKPYKCLKCGKAFQLLWHHRNHVARCKPIQCFHCKEYISRRQIAIHSLEMHNDCKPYKCLSCNRDFKKYSNYQDHMEGHEGFPCDVCKKVFKVKISLERHKQKFVNARCDLVMVRPKGCFAKTKVCFTCGEKFTNIKEFARHKTIHTTTICEVCGKGFRNTAALTTHKSTHNPENTEICHTCGKGYKNKSSLRHHMLTHYSTRQLVCDRCPKKFRFRNTLLSHVKREHDKIRDIPCRGCDMMFSTSGKMRLHYRTIHLRLKPYKCDVCDRNFARNEHVKLHKRNVHDKEKNESDTSSSSPRKQK